MFRCKILLDNQRTVVTLRQQRMHEIGDIHDPTIKIGHDALFEGAVAVDVFRQNLLPEGTIDILEMDGVDACGVAQEEGFGVGLPVGVVAGVEAEPHQRRIRLGKQPLYLIFMLDAGADMGWKLNCKPCSRAMPAAVMVCSTTVRQPASSTTPIWAFG